MRYTLVVLLVAAMALTGCKKKNNDLQTAIDEPPAAPIEDLSAVPAPEAAPVVMPAPYAPAATYQPAPAAAAGRTYVVQRGDTLWSIATRELGSGKRWTEISDLNDGLQPKALKTGQTITLPAR